MKRHVEWEPTNAHGLMWRAECGGLYRGYVCRLSMGRYVANVRGRRTRYYSATMREGAKYLVAFVNGVSPSKIR